jgi:CubicO group peptidase (beta-lactamase class C family)
MRRPSGYHPRVLRRTACALAVSIGPWAASGQDGGMLASRIDGLMADWARADSPGCAVGVVRDGALAFAKGYGQADLERGVPIGPASVFDIASTSKQFTAAVIALLAQDGKLSLDDDVRRFVPELPRYEAPITIRHLLHHTSGLRDYTDLMALEGWQMEDWTTEAQALATIVRQKEVNFRPGAQHLYSNSGFFLLSVIAARAGGQPFPDLARERIFEPLGMRSTHFHADHGLLVKGRAIGYAPREGGWALSLSDWEQTGDGSVLTTVEDLARWVGNFEDPKVGGVALVEELQRKGRLASGEEIDYAEGLRHATYRGLATLGHNGSWAGYRSSLLRFPSEKTVVIVLCNAENAEAGTIARKVADAALGDRLGPAPSPTPRASPTPAAKGRAITASELAALPGRYRSDELASDIEVRADKGRLGFRIRDRESPLVPIKEDEFTVDDPLSMTVAFTRDAAGKATGLILTCGCDGFRTLRLERVP